MDADKLILYPIEINPFILKIYVLQLINPPIKYFVDTNLLLIAPNTH